MTTKTALDEIADALRGLVLSVRTASDEWAGDVTADAPARIDWGAHELPGEWGPQLLQDAYRTGVMYSWIAHDHVLGLADVIVGARAVAPTSLARGIAEASARGWYLMQEGVDATERVRRLVNDILFAGFEHATLWLDEPRVSTELGTIYDRVRREAERRGLTFTNEIRDTQRNRYRPAHVGEARPKTQRLLADLTGQAKYARHFYRASSAVTHAALHGMDGRFALIDGPAPRAFLAGLEPDRVLADVTFAVRVYIGLISTLINQTGWRPREVTGAVERAEDVWQRMASADSNPTPSRQ